MSFTESLLLAIAIINAIGAILAWVAKIKWSKEYRNATDRLLAAKEEIINTKIAEIEGLQKHIENLVRLNPKEIYEWYEGMKKIAYEYTNGLKEQLDLAETKIKDLEKENNDKSIKAKKAYDDLLQDYDVLKLTSNQHRVPNFGTLVNSIASSNALSDSTSVASPTYLLKEMFYVPKVIQDDVTVENGKKEK